MSRSADLVFSGSGTLIDALGGAGCALEEAYGVKPRRLAGVSGGSIISCARAFGQPWAEAKELGTEVLSSGKLLDLSLQPWDRWGFFKGDYVEGLLRSTFPKRMGDAPTPWACYAVDLWKGKVVRFSSGETPEVPAALAVRASMALPLILKGVEWNGSFLIDGGIGVNLAMDAFDDDPSAPTIGIRFTPTARKTSNPVKLTALDFLYPPNAIKKASKYAQHLIEMMLENGNRAHVSKKHYQRQFSIDAGRESGMDFILSPEDVQKRWDLGYKTISDQSHRLQSLFGEFS